MSVSQMTLKNAPNDGGEQAGVPLKSSKLSTKAEDSEQRTTEQSEDSTEESVGDIVQQLSEMSLNEWATESKNANSMESHSGNLSGVDMACSSFSSCDSYHTIRDMILRRDPHTSTYSLDSCNSSLLINSCDKLRDCRVAGGKDSPCGSMHVVMEPNQNFTPHSCVDISVKEVGIGLEEVYKKFVAWFKRPEIDVAFKAFNEVDEDADGYIALNDLIRGLEKLSVPQTHREAKNVMAQVAGPRCSAVHFSHFLLIYASLLKRLPLNTWPTRDAETDRFSSVEEVDVSQVGVLGARRYFEAKITLEGERLKPLSLMRTQPVARPSSLSSSATENSTDSDSKEPHKKKD